MTLNQRIQSFVKLGNLLAEGSPALTEIIQSAHRHNAWFTPQNIEQALKANTELLNEERLARWLERYAVDFEQDTPATVGLVLAGNIPMVGFHDVLCSLISGFSVQIKTSSDDKQLIPYLMNELVKIEPAFKTKIQLTDRLSNFDLIIATGSNNTSRYFEYYFQKVPHIIRKNRNSVAVLNGRESAEELKKLGHDIFDYFGLGCRNVSKIFFPHGYDYARFFEAIESFSSISNHFKYHNNYDYNKAIYLVNGDKHLDNGFLLLKEDKRIASPLAVVYYEEYTELKEVLTRLDSVQDSIQCAVSNLPLSIPATGFGESQQPGLSDYADGINILDFLKANRR